MMTNIDMARLRQDLHNDYTLELHCGSSMEDLADMIHLQKGPDEKVLEIAQKKGVNLDDYIIT